MPPDPPQVLFVDLSAADGGRWGPQPWRPAAADLAGCAPWAGGGLATLLLLESARAGEHGAFALAVGDGVRRGVPTAARATVAARAPLTGRLAEGLVGGGLGRRLAGLADALLLRGTVPGGAGVLVLERDGARLERMPELAGLDPVATHAALERRLGRCASLRVGAAGERGLPVASLAGSDRVPSFVGRGGLGAAFAGLGLKALAVTASELATSPDPELVQALTASPRLQARAAGGTFELGPARAARGELDRDAGQALARDAAETPRERVGCRGCPTPCGWAFTRPSSGGAGSPGQPARFGKLWSLGPPLGLASFDDALRLAAACDRVGVDAKEVGAALGLLARERGALGDLERLCAWVDALGSERDEEARLIGRGAAAVAAALGRPSPTRAGEARDPDRGAAAVLA
ncbi:MAG: aldehyde ferredoxin oxidoreductase N-terminal domain-containing protein, partial [Planctomycetota bacterium]